MKRSSLLAVLVLVCSFSLMGCPKKPTVAPEDGSGANSGQVDSGNVGDANMSDSDSGNAMGLQTIRFPYDSFEIVGQNKAILKANAKIMQENPALAVQIEGHCDERGGVQYNLALGEKRAAAVKQQMVAAGVAGSRITTISMGKEKPVAQGSNEEAWAQNRRANFVITAK